jgi:hypothetical protein
LAARQDEEEMHVGLGVFGSIGREEGNRMGIGGEEPEDGGGREPDA